jgi:hypothetical protein
MEGLPVYPYKIVERALEGDEPHIEQEHAILSIWVQDLPPRKAMEGVPHLGRHEIHVFPVTGVAVAIAYAVNDHEALVFQYGSLNERSIAMNHTSINSRPSRRWGWNSPQSGRQVIAT